MAVFDRTKEISKKRGLSLQQVATKAGIGINSIYQWKTQTPGIDRLTKVAEVLNVSVDYLLGKTDNPSSDMGQNTVDINDDTAILTFDGQPIPDEDMELVREILRRTRNGER